MWNKKLSQYFCLGDQWRKNRKEISPLCLQDFIPQWNSARLVAETLLFTIYNNTTVFNLPIITSILVRFTSIVKETFLREVRKKSTIWGEKVSDAEYMKVWKYLQLTIFQVNFFTIKNIHDSNILMQQGIRHASYIMNLLKCCDLLLSKITTNFHA